MREETEKAGKFAGSYHYKGREVAFDIYANGLEDAKARMAAIKAFGKIDGGPIVMVIPAGPARVGGLLVRLIVWFKNFRQRHWKLE